ncbi:hypothetical protein YH65_04245 [Sulfurovum lithotrophicum]|uniref:RiboL-PSP-HEPN domain-containing protein n=1 Tax=Sulfurovum lithotrophicum TaxID=206403 RepID=A0A7U4M0Q6_9BACT|nr:hypothetical protein [Sulfurovum lithotrophicum]AKF24684.1 hypothetical protein YH65_04245 [Sulfurovum lithotrophicum]
MTYSAVEDNWLRVELMYSVTNKYFNLTKGTDFRERIINNQSMFPYCVASSQNMSKESTLVGMVMAWSVVALESLLNHALAEKAISIEIGKKTINDPNKVLKQIGITHSYKSKFSAKLIILKNESSNVVMDLADKLTIIRNTIIHDKPIDYYENDGDVEIEHYGDSEVNTLITYRHRGQA